MQPDPFRLQTSITLRLGHPDRKRGPMELGFLYVTQKEPFTSNHDRLASTGTTNQPYGFGAEAEASLHPHGWKLLNWLAISPLRPSASNLNFGALVDGERE